MPRFRLSASIGSKTVALLLLLILLIPVVEVYVFVQVSHQLGFLTTLGVLVLVSILGAWLVKYGIAVWHRLQQQLGAGNVPTNEIIDGFLVLLAGALLLTPGFVTDALGIVLLVPPVRAGVRSLARRRYTKQVRIIRATHTGPTYDVSGEETGRGEELNP
jgi:UPF0716 protein FxsA